MMLLAVENLSFNYTDKPLLKDVSLYLNEGEKIGLIGVNGSGKSTLIDFLINKPSYRHPNLKMGYLPQNPIFEPNKTILEIVSENVKEELLYEAKSILSKLGIKDINEYPENLSGGERRKIAIAEALVSDNNLLILDEPTNHMDIETISWLEKYLIRYKGALLLVTHDRYFLERITNRIVELDNGSLYSYNGNYDQYLELRAARIQNDIRVNEKKKAFLKREIEWVKAGVLARETKSKSRLEKYYQIKYSVKNYQESNLIMKSDAKYLGKKTIECIDISKTMNRQLLFEHFNYLLLRNDRLGIIGANGVGKSTLLKTMVGLIKPDSGSVIVGETVKIGYFSQEHDTINMNMKVIDYINELEEYNNAANSLEDFLFPRSMQQTTIGRLSGGERRRLELLRIIMQNPNVLILDEPTNDLDIQTLNILENYLEDFPGAVIVVSHDRYFLDRIVDHVLVMHDGNINEFLGGYSSYIKLLEEDTPKEEKVIKEKKHQNKMSYNEKKELATLESRISYIEGRLKEIDFEIEKNPSSYMLVSDLSKESEKLKEELDDISLRYLELLEKS